MDTPHDNHMKPKRILYWTAAAALAIGALSALWFVSAYARSLKPDAYGGTFTVSAEGRATAIPDIAQISFSVTTEGNKDINAAQAENTQKMNDVTSFLEDQDIDSADIKTTGYTVSPQYQYFPCTTGVCRPPVISGYSISQTVSVKVRDLEKAGDIVTGAVSRGANGVNGPTFVVDDATRVENDARAEAIEKAQAKAEAIADEAGFGLGKLISISDNGGSVPMPYAANQSFAKDSIGAAAPSPEFQPGSQEVTASVSLTYTIR